MLFPQWDFPHLKTNCCPASLMGIEPCHACVVSPGQSISWLTLVGVVDVSKSPGGTSYLCLIRGYVGLAKVLKELTALWEVMRLLGEGWLGAWRDGCMAKTEQMLTEGLWPKGSFQVSCLAGCPLGDGQAEVTLKDGYADKLLGDKKGWKLTLCHITVVNAVYGLLAKRLWR